jgi:hypothetical protein
VKENNIRMDWVKRQWRGKGARSFMHSDWGGRGSWPTAKGKILSVWLPRRFLKTPHHPPPVFKGTAIAHQTG